MNRVDVVDLVVDLVDVDLVDVDLDIDLVDVDLDVDLVDVGLVDVVLDCIGQGRPPLYFGASGSWLYFGLFAPSCTWALMSKTVLFWRNLTVILCSIDAV